MSRIKLIMCIVLTFVLCIMTLGYAALQEKIDVEVEANIDSTYRVEITRVQEGTAEGDARSVQVPSYNNLTSTFNVGLTNDTDYITYTIEVTNYSTVDIRLNNVEITNTNNNVRVTKYGIRNGDIMLAGSTKTITIRIKLDTETGNEQTGTVTLTFDFTRLKGGVGGVVSDLPSGYQELEYIEGTGTQYINTGFVPNQDTRVIMDFQMINPEYGKRIFGTRKGSREQAYCFYYQPASYKYGFYVNYRDSEYFPKESGYNYDRHLVDFNKNNVYLDGTLFYSFSYNNFTGYGTAYIFDLNSPSTGTRGAFRLYLCQIYDDEELVRDYIPALDNNDVPCLYDTVTGETFYNQGTGTFLYQLKE